jgi:hypothetical protein
LSAYDQHYKKIPPGRDLIPFGYGQISLPHVTINCGLQGFGLKNGTIANINMSAKFLLVEINRKMVVFLINPKTYPNIEQIFCAAILHRVQ